MQDVWSGRRLLLNDAISRSLDTIEFGHGQLVREQIEAADPREYETAALACLAAAEAAGGSAEAAMPGAVALTFLSQMGLVFMGLENSGGAASLSTAWGMPRSLNAGDAMFALAQATVLTMAGELTAGKRLQAVGILDWGTRALIDALFAMSEDADSATVGQRALIPAAMALGPLLGGGDTEAGQRLLQLGFDWSLLPAEELSRRLAGDPRRWLAT